MVRPRRSARTIRMGAPHHCVPCRGASRYTEPPLCPMACVKPHRWHVRRTRTTGRPPCSQDHARAGEPISSTCQSSAPHCGQGRRAADPSASCVCIEEGCHPGWLSTASHRWHPVGGGSCDEACSAVMLTLSGHTERKRGSSSTAVMIDIDPLESGTLDVGERSAPLQAVGRGHRRIRRSPVTLRSGFVLLGCLGAASDHRVETFASGAGLVLLALVVVWWTT